MNPAALKVNLSAVPRGGTVIVNTDEFTERALKKVGYAANPLEDGSLDDYQRAQGRADLADRARAGRHPLSRKEAERAKNMYALGLLSWLYHRPIEQTLRFLEQKFAKQPADHRGQPRGLPGRLELRRDHRGVRGLLRGGPGRAARRAATATSPATGALAYGLIAARSGAGFRCSSALPDHPGLRHPARAGQAQELRRAHLPGRGRDRRDRRGARRGVRRGPRRDHDLAAPASRSSPRRSAWRSRSNCRWSICDIQRGGPSTGLPTKTEQADLLQAMFGRNGESPVPIVAPRPPADCFDVAMEACGSR